MSKRMLITAAAVGALVIGGVGILLGQTLFDPHGRGSVAGADEGVGHAEEGHGGAEGVAMTAEQVKGAGIEIVRANTGVMTGGIEAQGSIAAAPEGLAVLSARTTGSIAAISKRLGDPVARGEVIARIESGEGAGLAAALASAQSRARLARSAFERERHLFEANVTARQDFEAAQEVLTTAEAELASAKAAMTAAGVSGDGRYVMVRSPIAGRIIAVRATLGAFVDANAELFRVADPGKVHVESALTALDAGRVRPGDKAEIILRDKTIAATVRAVTPGLDAASKTATAVLSLDTYDASMQPGQFVRVHISPKASRSTAAIIVPDEAVQSFEGKNVVFARTASGFEARPVTVGMRSGGRAEILAGLNPGEEVAGKNAFLVKAEIGKSEASHED